MSAQHGNPFKPTERMLRQFAGLWIVFFGGMAIWQAVQHGRIVLAGVLAVLAVTVGPLGLMWPKLIRPVFVGWMTLVFPIGWVVSRIVLGTVFYGLFTPVALFFRLIGRDELALRRAPDATTYWRPKAMADKAQYLKQF